MGPSMFGSASAQEQIFDKSFRRSWVINGGDFTFYFERPICIALMVLCATLAYHSYLGVQVVIEDYVHGPRLGWFSLVLSRAVHLAVGLLMVYTVYDIGFGA